MRNWIVTSNPYSLAEPPAWFLQALHAYDPLLVIFASVSAPVYRMARRTSTGRAQLNKVLKSYPDSEVYFAHKLWAWKSVEPMQIGGLRHGMTWQKLLLEIPEYDQQRFPNAGAAADALDALEQRQEDETDARIQTDLEGRHHDAYIMASTIDGSRMKATRGSGRKRQPVYRPPAFGGGSAIFTGR